MKLLFMEDLYEIRFVKGAYTNNGNLYIGVEDQDEDGYWEDFCDVTINFDIECDKDCSFLNVPDLPIEVYELILPYIEKTGKFVDNGFIQYPEVRFSHNLLEVAIEVSE